MVGLYITILIGSAWVQHTSENMHCLPSANQCWRSHALACAWSRAHESHAVLSHMQCDNEQKGRHHNPASRWGRRRGDQHLWARLALPCMTVTEEIQAFVMPISQQHGACFAQASAQTKHQQQACAPQEYKLCLGDSIAPYLECLQSPLGHDVDDSSQAKSLLDGGICIWHDSQRVPVQTTPILTNHLQHHHHTH